MLVRTEDTLHRIEDADKPVDKDNEILTSCLSLSLDLKKAIIKDEDRMCIVDVPKEKTTKYARFRV